MDVPYLFITDDTLNHPLISVWGSFQPRTLTFSIDNAHSAQGYLIEPLVMEASHFLVPFYDVF